MPTTETWANSASGVEGLSGTAATAAAAAAAAPDRPVVAVGGPSPPQETEPVRGIAIVVVAAVAVIVVVLAVSELLVAGARQLADSRRGRTASASACRAGGRGRKRVRTTVPDDGGAQATADQVDGVVVVEVHGGPPDPADVGDEKRAQAGEVVAEKRASRVASAACRLGKAPKGTGAVVKLVVYMSTPSSLSTLARPAGEPGHAVVGRLEAVGALVPRRRARHEELQRDAQAAQVAERPREEGRGAGRGEQEEHDRAGGGRGEVAEPVGDPGQHVEHGVGVGREDVGEVGAVHDVLERWQHLDPDVRAVFDGDVAVGEAAASESARRRREGWGVWVSELLAAASKLTYRLEKK